MRRYLVLVMVLVLAMAACGGDDSGSDGNGDSDGGNAATSDGGDDLSLEDLGFDSDFDTGDLPDGFPSELVPPNDIAGQLVEIGGITSVSYYSELSFDEALGRYEELLGVAPIVAGEVGQRVATWTQNTDWVVGLFEEDPLLITFTEVSG